MKSRACGSWAWWHKDHGYIRWFCGSGKCDREICRNKFWSKRIRLISALITEYNLRKFFTLTLDRESLGTEIDPWEYIHHPWSKLRKRLARRFKDFKFIAVLEYHPKSPEWPHIHGFTNIWMSQNHWSDMWAMCGGGSIVWVERVKDGGVSEYVNKQIEVAKYVGKQQLIGGYTRKKRHRTVWRSTGMKACFELEESEGWCIIKDEVYAETGETRGFYKDREEKYGG